MEHLKRVFKVIRSYPPSYCFKKAKELRKINKEVNRILLDDRNSQIVTLKPNQYQQIYKKNIKHDLAYSVKYP